MTNFSEALCELPCLTKLDLRFVSFDINDYALEIFSSAFTRLQNVSELSLQFPNTNKITSVGVNELFSNFGSLKSLKTLRVNFDLRQKYLGSVLNILYEGVKELEFLSFMYLKMSLEKETNDLKAFTSSLQNVKVDFHTV